MRLHRCIALHHRLAEDDLASTHLRPCSEAIPAPSYCPNGPWSVRPRCARTTDDSAIRIRYYVSAVDNALYDGGFALASRYQTYGQQSFIYDFVRCATRLGVSMELVLDQLDLFPLAEPISRHCHVTELGRDALASHPDVLLLDTITDAMLSALPTAVPAITVVHRARQTFSAGVIARSNKFLCMTPNALAIQSERLPASRLALITQGVDLTRFQPTRCAARAESEPPRVLWYTRLSTGKRNTLFQTLEGLIQTPVRLTLLGDGPLFWEISDRFGEAISLVSFIPCHSIHNFISSYDVVISSGRGVMEALACGVPSICAGLGYAGVVTPTNIASLLDYNLTGWLLPAGPAPVADDIHRACLISGHICRQMAEQHLDGLVTVRQVVRLISGLSSV